MRVTTDLEIAPQGKHTMSTTKAMLQSFIQVNSNKLLELRKTLLQQIEVQVQHAVRLGKLDALSRSYPATMASSRSPMHGIELNAVNADCAVDVQREKT